jgi:hypothetical protein
MIHLRTGTEPEFRGYHELAGARPRRACLTFRDLTGLSEATDNCDSRIVHVSKRRESKRQGSSEVGCSISDRGAHRLIIVSRSHCKPGGRTIVQVQVSLIVGVGDK